MLLPPHGEPGGRGGRVLPARRLDRIVIGVDFTEPSLAVVGWVGRHFAPVAELALLHVARMPTAPNVFDRAPIRPHGPNRFGTGLGPAGDTTRALKGALRGLASLIGGTHVRVDVRAGDPATELAVYADLVDADLVVVGASAAYHVAPRHLTATTERILRRTNRPVLISRNLPSEAPATVLAAVADDVDAPRVLQAAWMVAGACKARVAGLRVIARERSAGSAEWVERWLRVADIPPARSAAMVADGEPVRAILTAARLLPAEIIAIGTRASVGEARGVNGVNDNGGDGTGDAARTIARMASCSVLVVPHSAEVHVTPPGRTRVVGHTWHSGEPGPRRRASDQDDPTPPAAARRNTNDAA